MAAVLHSAACNAGVRTLRRMSCLKIAMISLVSSVEACHPTVGPGEVRPHLLVGGSSCQARQRACLVRPWFAGLFGFVEPYLSRQWMALAPTLTYATSDHDHGSVGVVRAAVVAKGRPPN